MCSAACIRQQRERLTCCKGAAADRLDVVQLAFRDEGVCPHHFLESVSQRQLAASLRILLRVRLLLLWRGCCSCCVLPQALVRLPLLLILGWSLYAVKFYTGRSVRLSLQAQVPCCSTAWRLSCRARLLRETGQLSQAWR